MGEIHAVEVPGRGGLYEQEDVPSDWSRRSRRFSMIAEIFPTIIIAWGLRVPATNLHMEENARVSALSPRKEAVNGPSET